MSIYRTKNYELSANIRGPKDSNRLALIHPGFLETHKYAHMEAYVDLFASLGYRAIAFNAPGIWSSRIRQGIKNREREYSMYRQVEAGFEICDQEIKRNPDIKITAVGHSGGGRPAVHEALAFPDKVDSLILDRVGYKWIRPSCEARKKGEWEEEGIKSFAKQHPDGGPDVEFDVDYDYSERAKDYDIDESIKTLTIPKLQIAGLLDDVALPHETLADFRFAAEPKELVWMPTDHFYLSWMNIMNNARNYTNQDTIRYNVDIVRDWLSSNELLPSQIGRLALRQS